MKKEIRTEAVNQLFDAIASLNGREEYYKFFQDICTVNELLSLAQRFDVGKNLLEGRTYQEISKKTGASTVTISRVNRLLSDQDSGIEMAVKRICPVQAETGPA